MRASSLSSFIFAFLPCINLSASEKLSWNDCAREVISKNHDLQSAEHAIERVRSQHRASYSPFLPQIFAEAGYNRNDTFSLDEFFYGVSAKQSLFSGFRDKAQFERTKLDIEIEENRFQIAKAKVSADLKNAFAQMLYSAEQLKLSEEITARRKDNLELVQLRFESGRENKGSYLRNQAQLKQAQYEVAQAKRTRAVAQKDLLRVLARSFSSDVEIEGTLEIPKIVTKPNFEELVLRTPQYLVAKAEAQSAEKAVTIARGQFFPDLALHGSFSKTGAAFPPNENRFAFGVTLSFPLFPGGKNIFDLQSTRAERERSQSTLHALRDQLTVTLQDFFARFEDAVERTAVQEDFYIAAQMRADVARAKYTNGLLSFEDWDIIENDLISTKKTRLQSFRDAWLAEAAWEQATGQGTLP